MNKEHQMDDEDLEIPEIDRIPGLTKNRDSLETTGADGIPFFLKGEKPHAGNEQQGKHTESQNGIPSFLTGDQREEKTLGPQEIMSEPEYENPESEEKKRSSVFHVLLSLIVFVILTAVLLAAGITVVNSNMRKPQEAPIETEIPEETAAPAATAVPSADSAG